MCVQAAICPQLDFEEISNGDNHLRKLQDKGLERMCIPDFREMKVTQPLVHRAPVSNAFVLRCFRLAK